MASFFQLRSVSLGVSDEFRGLRHSMAEASQVPHEDKRAARASSSGVNITENVNNRCPCLVTVFQTVLNTYPLE